MVTAQVEHSSSCSSDGLLARCGLQTSMTRMSIVLLARSSDDTYSYSSVFVGL